MIKQATNMIIFSDHLIVQSNEGNDLKLKGKKIVNIFILNLMIRRHLTSSRNIDTNMILIINLIVQSDSYDP